METAYRNAETTQDKEDVLRSYGFDLDDFYEKAIKRTNIRMIKMGVDAHAQRTADYLTKKRRTIYRYI